MRLPTNPGQQALLNRRTALVNAFVSGLAVFAGHRLPALAAYTVVPSGSIADKQARLREVEKLFKETPDDPYVFGEKAQLEFDIGALERNKQYAASIAGRVDAGQSRYATRLTVPVPNMASAVGFWTSGCGALVLDTKLVDGQNVTRIGFGPEVSQPASPCRPAGPPHWRPHTAVRARQSLRKDDGAKFSLEMVESPEPSKLGQDGAVVQYIQLAMPVFRLSRVMAAGGEIESAYGYTELTAPGGVPLKVRIDETRRDPFEFVALRTNNLEKTIKHYEAQGMKVLSTTGRKKLKISINSNSLFENSDALEPERELGSVQMGYDDATLSTGVLLLPPKSRTKLDAPHPAIRLSVVGAAPTAEPQSLNPDGFSSVFVSSADFEASLAGSKIGVAVQGLPL